MRKSTTASPVEASVAEVKPATKRGTRTRKKAQEAAPQATEETVEDVAQEQAEQAAPATLEKEAPAEAPKTEKETEKRVKNTVIPPLPRNIVVRDIVDLWNARIPLLNDQQVQQITLEEAQARHLFFEAILTQVLDYDIVLSDTNIWLELLVGHTSSHSDPRVNARLMFERQLEFISRMMKKRGGRFVIMAETYEEIDRFACQQEPTNYQDADWTDPMLCRNVSARLAKRLILSQQRENRLRIEGITSESHHGSFADPAIIRRVVELFASGRKVLLMTNDASVAIRSMGMCDDLQRINNISDADWDAHYAPLRPMAITMDDLKQLDNYTRQYHFLQSAAGAAWMQDLTVQEPREAFPQMQLDENAFRPGDKHERRSDKEDRQRIEQQKEQRAQEQQKLEQQRQQLKSERQQMDQLRQQMKAERQQMEQMRQQMKAEQKAEQRRQQQQQRQAEQRVQEQVVANATAEAIAEEAAENQVETLAENNVAAVAEPVVANDNAVAVQNAEVQPSAVVADDNAVAANVESAAETVSSVVAELPGFSPEDMELLSTPSTKKRTHRGGRRRGGKSGANA
ncbi:MAG: hypothetical protein K6E73_12030 [Bacteroidales bacterium]|nr:hypothetical protein [Bacteroidales bacterium]